MSKKFFLPAVMALGLGLSATSQAVPDGAKARREARKTVTTKDGLKILDYRVGKGRLAVKGKTVYVNYRGTLTNGKVFDQSYGKSVFNFTLGAGQVIPGWDQGVTGMRVGGRRRLIIPSKLGYGAQGAGADIPPNATLIFQVELLGVK